jgi:small ligand-binding sensory domain FIST
VASEYQDHFQRGDFLVRNVVGADPDSGVIAVGDLVRTGQTIQFHVRDAKSAHDDLEALLTREQGRGAAPVGALVFSCNGRGTRLFPEPNHDARCLRDTIGPIPAAGFFAQGEIGPIGRHNCLHGFTASIALVEAGE